MAGLVHASAPSKADTKKELNRELPRDVESFKESKVMIGKDLQSPEVADRWEATATREPHHRFRLLIVMAQGSAGGLPEAWRSYARIEDARASALQALRDPQVRRVAIVQDESGLPLRLVEWVGCHLNAFDLSHGCHIPT
jgi:hypothetical protein